MKVLALSKHNQTRRLYGAFLIAVYLEVLLAYLQPNCNKLNSKISSSEDTLSVNKWLTNYITVIETPFIHLRKKKGRYLSVWIDTRLEEKRDCIFRLLGFLPLAMESQGKPASLNSLGHNLQ
jgi:hypothetical protein